MNNGNLPGDLPDKGPAVPKELADAERDLDILVAKTFSSPAGQKTWEWLRSITVEAPVLSISDGFSGIMIGYSREGQNALIRKVEGRIKRANSK